MNTATGSQTIANRANHVNGQIDVNVDPAFGGSYTSTGHAPGAAVGSCQNVYCHSNAQPDGGVGGPTVYNTPEWGGADSVNCGSCHAGDGGHGHSGAMIATGSHGKHLTYGFTATSNTVRCMICHKYTDQPFVPTCFGNPYGNTVCHWGTGAKHANGKIDVIIEPTFGNMSAYQGGTEPGNGYSNCSNTYCHSNGSSIATGVIPASTTTTWGSGVLACNACHGNPPAYVNNEPKANAHAAHSGEGCGSCHYSTTTDGLTIASTVNHVNKSYDLTPGPGITFTYTFAPTGGSCSSNSCHNDGTAVATGIAQTVDAQWGATNGCSVCHGNPPSYPNGSPKSNGHMGKHLPYSCDKCHYGFPSGHANASYTVSSGPGIKMTYTLSYNSTCSNVSCHGDGTSTTTFIAPVNGPLNWGGTATFTCGGCHSLPPSYTDRSPKANAHGSHTSYGCQVCHYNITTDGATVTDISRHADGYYNISSNGSASFRYSFGSRGSSCSDISCHADGARHRNWTYQPLDLGWVSPPAGYTNTDVNSKVTLSFYEPMDMTTVNSGTFYLKQGETMVPGGYSYENNSANSYYIVFTPSQPLLSSTTYTATFTNDIKAATGVNITSGRSFSFTTVQ